MKIIKNIVVLTSIMTRSDAYFCYNSNIRQRSILSNHITRINNLTIINSLAKYHLQQNYDISSSTIRKTKCVPPRSSSEALFLSHSKYQPHTFFTRDNAIGEQINSNISNRFHQYHQEKLQIWMRTIKNRSYGSILFTANSRQQQQHQRKNKRGIMGKAGLKSRAIQSEMGNNAEMFIGRRLELPIAKVQTPRSIIKNIECALVTFAVILYSVASKIGNNIGNQMANGLKNLKGLPRASPMRLNTSIPQNDQTSYQNPLSQSISANQRNMFLNLGSLSTNAVIFLSGICAKINNNVGTQVVNGIKGIRDTQKQGMTLKKINHDKTKPTTAVKINNKQKKHRQSPQQKSTIDNKDPDVLTRTLKHTIQYLLYERWSKFATGVSVDVDLKPSTISRLISKHEVGSNITLRFDELSLPNIEISGGGHLDINKLNVHLLALVLPQDTLLGNLVRRGKEIRRFRSRFELHARECMLMQSDILSSSCIKNGLQVLLRRILRRGVGILGDIEVTVNTVNVLPSNKISCTGEALSQFGNMSFEVRSGLGTTGQGQVLTLPGLELALGIGRALKIFVPIYLDGFREVDVDLGHDAKIESIRIDGSRRCIQLSARITVTPEDVFGSQEKKEAASCKRLKVPGTEQFLARYACDAGQWVTNLGNFHN